jgi:hypothetical protein
MIPATKGTYHSKDKSKRIDGYGIEIPAVLDTVTLVVFKQCIFQDVENDPVFRKPSNSFLILRLG